VFTVLDSYSLLMMPTWWKHKSVKSWS